MDVDRQENRLKFGWKRKLTTQAVPATESVSSSSNSSGKRKAFWDPQPEELSGDNELVHDIDWVALRRAKTICLEDTSTKCRRLKEEGTLLAENERYWEAIKKFDEAISLIPGDASLWEMKSQALLCVNEIFPAIQCSEKVVKLDPSWSVGLQTLGRAQLGKGEVEMALKSFSRAVHLNPSIREVWEEDLLWTVELIKKKKKISRKVPLVVVGKRTITDHCVITQHTEHQTEMEVEVDDDS